MKLNRLEYMAMNSPMRAFVQEHYELRILRAMSATTGRSMVLEIGCGNGHGTSLIKKYYWPENIVAIDLDEKMIGLATKRNHDPAICYKVMDTAKMEFPDGYFDSIFDFAIIHHIPNWRDALRELRRVLRPGGELIIEDLSIASFSTGIGLLWKRLSDHPYEYMYTPREFTEFLKEIGFAVIEYRETNPLGIVKFFWLVAIANEGQATVA